MIRPLTIATFLLACGSGLYLYQSKHEVQVLDRTIEKTVHDTNALREQSRLLAAEWTMLNDPERLRQFSDTYLNLKSINPAQFTSLSDLNNKLPPPQVAAPVVEEPALANEAPPQPMPEAAPAVADADVMPVPPAGIAPTGAAKIPAVAAAARAPEAKTAAIRPAGLENQSHPSPVADLRTVAPQIAATRPETRTAAVSAPRPIVLAAPRANIPSYPQTSAPPTFGPQTSGPQTTVTQSAAAQPVLARPTSVQPASSQGIQAQNRLAQAPAPVPYTGSLLGMARGSMPPAPRPTPVNATYNSN
jgi:hypothetical protein